MERTLCPTPDKWREYVFVKSIDDDPMIDRFILKLFLYVCIFIYIYINDPKDGG